MKRKRFDADNRGVSPVIGVILMVAVTVILATVIGTFVLGEGDQVSDSPPQGSFNFDVSDDYNVTIAYEGGSALDPNDLEVRVGSTTAWNASDGANSPWTDASGWDSDITSGSSLELLQDSPTDSQSGETIRVVWQSSSSGETYTIARTEWP